MKCIKCGSEWFPAKELNISDSNCPFCGIEILNIDKAKGLKNISDFLQYLVAIYGKEIYSDKQKLSNLFLDLYSGEDREKRLYRRVILEDGISQRVYAIGLKNINEVQSLLNQLTDDFCDANFYSLEIGKTVIDAFTTGLGINLRKPVSTIAKRSDREWIDEFGVIYSVDRSMLIKAPTSLTGKYSVLYKCKTICENSFNMCNGLTSIYIPDSVTDIKMGAFKECANLKSINIPKSVHTIGNSAFSECANLTNINISENVKTIGNYAFAECPNLRNISISSDFTSIGYYAFNK